MFQIRRLGENALSNYFWWADFGPARRLIDLLALLLGAALALWWLWLLLWWLWSQAGAVGSLLDALLIVPVVLLAARAR